VTSVRVYRDADGATKPFEQLSTRGFKDNAEAGAFAVGDCATDGHLLGQFVLRTNPLTFPCARCHASFRLVNGEYVPVPR
jgi:hypothetical protein